MEPLYTPLFGDLLPTAGLGNAYWMSNQPAYEDHQGEAGYGPATSTRLEAAARGRRLRRRRRRHLRAPDRRAPVAAGRHDRRQPAA